MEELLVRKLNIYSDTVQSYCVIITWYKMQVCQLAVILWMHCAFIFIFFLFIYIYIMLVLMSWSPCFTAHPHHPLRNSLIGNQLLIFHWSLPSWLMADSASINHLVGRFNDLCASVKDAAAVKTRTVHTLYQSLDFIMKRGPKIKYEEK